MIFDKKDKRCEKVKNKLKVLHNMLSKIRDVEELNRHEEGAYYITETPSHLYPTSQEYKAYDKYCGRKYFTNKDKDIIIDYLLDCLVNDEAFDYSTLGPNIYKNEHSISNVSDT
jgi:hypothetical protein